MEVREAIRTLRAVRQFRDERVPDEVLRQILHAGRRSQSSKNSQPWLFVVIRDHETLRRLSECGAYAGHLAGADFDLGQACACMMLAARELGVGSCIASMHEPEKAQAILGVPPELRCDTAISFGYPAAGWQPARMGGRRPLEEVVRWEKWA